MIGPPYEGYPVKHKDFGPRVEAVNYIATDPRRRTQTLINARLFGEI